MTSEVRINVVIRMPEVPTPDQPLPAKTALLAWEALTTAIQDTDVVTNDFYLGPAKPGRPPRNRKSKPALSIAKPPPTAA